MEILGYIFYNLILFPYQVKSEFCDFVEIYGYLMITNQMSDHAVFNLHNISLQETSAV